MIYCNYLGFKQAIWYGLEDIIGVFYKNIKHLLTVEKSSCLTAIDLKREYLSYLRIKSPTMFLDELKVAPFIDENEDRAIGLMKASLQKLSK
jgi:hypothetical protein